MQSLEELFEFLRRINVVEHLQNLWDFTDPMYENNEQNKKNTFC